MLADSFRDIFGDTFPVEAEGSIQDQMKEAARLTEQEQPGKHLLLRITTTAKRIKVIL